MVNAQSSQNSQQWWYDIIALGGMILLFYLVWLGSYPLFTPDEGRYSEVAREMVATGDFITPKVNGVVFLDKPVLYYWLQATAILLFGVKEWALRIFPVLFGVMGCLGVYISGRILFDRRSAWFASLILATSPLYFSIAHYANLDLEVAVLISLSLLSFITGFQLQDKPRQYCWLAMYAFAALAMLTKGLIGFVFPAMIIGTWIVLRWQWWLLKKVYLGTGLILFLSIVCPWYILAQKANPEFFHYFFVTQHISRFLSTQAFNNKSPIWFYLPVIFIGFFPWIIFLVAALKSAFKHIFQNKKRDTYLYLLVWISLIFTFFSIPHSKIASYILPIFPPLALLTGHYLAKCSEQVIFAYLYAICAGILACIIWFMPAIKPNFFPSDFLPYTKLICLLLLSSSLLAIYIRKNVQGLLGLLVSVSVIFLLSITAGAKYLNLKSTKPLNTYLKTIIKPEDEIVNYRIFFQDIPLYLNRTITIVADWDAPNIADTDNWLRELWYGMTFKNTQASLINESALNAHWEDKKRIFVFLNEKNLKQFEAKQKHYYFLARKNNILLISNQK